MTKKLTKKQREAYKSIGRIGGKSLYKKVGKLGMSELGKKGMAKRWAKKTVDNPVVV